MLPAFRSTGAVWRFCALLALLLALPVVLSMLGHPSREQAYASLPDAAGPVAMHVWEIFHDPGDVDVLLLGSSLIRKGVDAEAMQRELTVHLGRPARVRLLALNWQGMDMDYFLLADYLKHHRVHLILWNSPVPGSRILEPHIEAFHLVRFGESSALIAGLPWRYRMALYGDMVLGAPRELLNFVRPNLLSPEAMRWSQASETTGYYGAPFVPDTPYPAQVPKLNLSCQSPPYPLVIKAGKPYSPYAKYFMHRILEVAAQNGARVALLHIPIDSERGESTMPERSLYKGPDYAGVPFIGVSSKALFKGIADRRFTHFYSDQHLNANGRTLFTRAILPAVIKVYDTGGCQ